MKLVKFDNNPDKFNRNNFVNSSEQISTEKIKKPNYNQDLESNTPMNNKKNYKCILISILIGIIIISGAIVGIVLWKKPKDPPENPNDPINPLPSYLNITEALTATSKLFNISSKINNLTQFSQKSIENMNQFQMEKKLQIIFYPKLQLI
jgi:hypothetical protein